MSKTMQRHVKRIELMIRSDRNEDYRRDYIYVGDIFPATRKDRAEHVRQAMLIARTLARAR